MVSNRGTSERSWPTSVCVRSSARRGSSGPGARDDHRVERARAVALERVADGSERRPASARSGRELVRVESHVELGDVEAEDLDAPAQIRQRAIGDACAAIGPQARVHQLEIGEQLARVGVARLGRRSSDFEAVADEAQLAPVRLVEF